MAEPDWEKSARKCGVDQMKNEISPGVISSCEETTIDPTPCEQTAIYTTVASEETQKHVANKNNTFSNTNIEKTNKIHEAKQICDKNIQLKCHYTTGRQKKLYACDTCKKEFKYLYSLRRHVQIHMDNVYSCDTCKKEFKSLYNLRRHVSIHNKIKTKLKHLREKNSTRTQKKLYSCDTCKKEYKHKFTLRRHITQSHNKIITKLKNPRDNSTRTQEKVYSYDICKKDFKRLFNLRRHIHSHTRQKQSNMIRKSDKQIESFHIKTNEETGEEEILSITFTCEICGQLCPTLNKALEHEMNHKEKSHSCEECGARFKERRFLKVHQQIHKKDKPYACDMCGQKFKLMEYLRRHKKVHIDEKLFKCSICEKAFKLQCTLQMHVTLIHTNTEQKAYSSEIFENEHKGLETSRETHAGSKQEPQTKGYSCDVCGKTYKRSHNLTAHKKIHTSQSYTCGTCEKVFMSSFNLKRHELTHAGVRPYSCDYCKKDFTQYQNLKKHLLTHMGVRTEKYEPVHKEEETYSCELCGEEFKELCALTTHKSTHDGENAYSCGICKEKFTTLGQAMKHKQIHDGYLDTPFSCVICKQGFNKLSNLKTHNVKRHTQKTNYCEEQSDTGITHEFNEHNYIEDQIYMCEVCGGKYKDFSSLRTHERTHAGWLSDE